VLVRKAWLIVVLAVLRAKRSRSVALCASAEGERDLPIAMTYRTGVKIPVASLTCGHNNSLIVMRGQSSSMYSYRGQHWAISFNSWVMHQVLLPRPSGIWVSKGLIFRYWLFVTNGKKVMKIHSSTIIDCLAWRQETFKSWEPGAG
jgi:hypothetical protein